MMRHLISNDSLIWRYNKYYTINGAGIELVDLYYHIFTVYMQYETDSFTLTKSVTAELLEY